MVSYHCLNISFLAKMLICPTMLRPRSHYLRIHQTPLPVLPSRSLCFPPLDRFLQLICSPKFRSSSLGRDYGTAFALYTPGPLLALVWALLKLMYLNGTPQLSYSFQANVSHLSHNVVPSVPSLIPCHRGDTLPAQKQTKRAAKG